MICPEAIETSSSPAISGSRYSPEMVGEMPRTTWKNAGRYVIAPNIAKPTMKPTRLVTEKVRSLNRCSGSTGSAARRSTSTNTPTSSAPRRAQDVDGRRPPRVGGAAQAGQQDQRGDGQRQHGGAEVVDHVVHPAQRAGYLAGHHDQRDHADRHVDVEDPAPGQVVHEHAAEQRADHAGQAEDGAEQPDVLAAFARRDDVADDGLRADHQAAGAQPLHGAERDELDHGRAEAGQDRADQEDDDRGLEEDLPAVLVAQLAPERGGHRRASR